MFSIYNPNTRTELVLTSNSEKKYYDSCDCCLIFFSIKKISIFICDRIFHKSRHDCLQNEYPPDLPKNYILKNNRQFSY